MLLLWSRLIIKDDCTDVTSYEIEIEIEIEIEMHELFSLALSLTIHLSDWLAQS